MRASVIDLLHELQEQTRRGLAVADLRHLLVSPAALGGAALVFLLLFLLLYLGRRRR